MNIEELKRDFEVFGKGVERLEELKAEFERIDASGHEKEAEEIRQMLKNVSAIPQLEIKIANLKNAINRKKELGDEFNKRLSEKESQIKEQAQKEIEAKKHELREEVEESLKHVLEEK